MSHTGRHNVKIHIVGQKLNYINGSQVKLHTFCVLRSPFRFCLLL